MNMIEYVLHVGRLLYGQQLNVLETCEKTKKYPQNITFHHVLFSNHRMYLLYVLCPLFLTVSFYF